MTLYYSDFSFFKLFNTLTKFPIGELNVRAKIVIGLFSIITNLADGMNETKLSHQETLENASLAENNVLNLIKQFISEVRLDDSTRNN